MAIAIVIVIILLAAAVTIFLTASRRRTTTGTLSRETRSRDQSVEVASEPAASTSTELEATGRPRADDTRENMPGDVAVRDSNDVVVWEPVDEEEIGVNRRQFLNRACSCVRLLGRRARHQDPRVPLADRIERLRRQDRRREHRRHPRSDLRQSGRRSTSRSPRRTSIRTRRARCQPQKKVASYKPVLPGYEEGLVALYQRCVHLGCRVPRGACLRSGSRAPATARSTTRSARSGTAPRRAVSTGSR